MQIGKKWREAEGRRKEEPGQGEGREREERKQHDERGELHNNKNKNKNGSGYCHGGCRWPGPVSGAPLQPPTEAGPLQQGNLGSGEGGLGDGWTSEDLAPWPGQIMGQESGWKVPLTKSDSLTALSAGLGMQQAIDDGWGMER